MSKKLQFAIYFFENRDIIDMYNYISGGTSRNVNKKKVVNGW